MIRDRHNRQSRQALPYAVGKRCLVCTPRDFPAYLFVIPSGVESQPERSRGTASSIAHARGAPGLDFETWESTNLNSPLFFERGRFSRRENRAYPHPRRAAPKPSSPKRIAEDYDDLCRKANNRSEAQISTNNCVYFSQIHAHTCIHQHNCSTWNNFGRLEPSLRRHTKQLRPAQIVPRGTIFARRCCPMSHAKPLPGRPVLSCAASEMRRCRRCASAEDDPVPA
jgi:hypothetical protein